MNKPIGEIKISNYCLLVIFLILFSGFIIKYFTFPVDAEALCSCKVCSFTGYCSNFQYNNSKDCPCRDKCTDHCECPGCPLYRCTTTTTTKPSTTTPTGAGYKCTSPETTGGGCYSVSSGATYSTLAACLTDCIYISYDCNYSNGQCVKRSDIGGSYWSKSSCENDCKVTYTYACRSGGVCVKEASTNGHKTLALCEECCNSNADCTETTYWDCDESTERCYSTKNGHFAVKIGCDQNCGGTNGGNGGGNGGGVSCSVKATASPNPIPEGQDQVTISATNLKNTSLSKCKVDGYSLPHTFTQTTSSKTYKVSCTGNSGYNNCSNSIKVTLEGTTSDPTAPPTTVPQCSINKFELPKRAWVDIETIASWSTINCDTAEINCISDDCIEGVENLSGEVSVGFDQKKNFTIKAPGTYRYELVACIGPIPADPHNDEEHCDVYEDVLGTGLEYIEIEVLHLPWWQEIIPILPDNLQGFLRGLIN